MTLHYYFWEHLDATGRRQYAKRCGISYDSMRIHHIPKRGGSRRTPRRKRLETMAKKSHGKVGYADVINHFFGGY